MDIKTQLIDLFKNAAAETGQQLRFDSANLAAYTAERAAWLATLAGQPGFDEAMIAERDNALLRAGIAAVDNADALDNRIVGIVTTVLSVGATALKDLGGPPATPSE
jgi:hypothetical protein